jgi:DNA modification methylase
MRVETMAQQPLLLGNGYALSRDLNPRRIAITGLTALGRETRKHPLAQIRKLQTSIERFGFVLPIIVDRRGRVVAGWALVLAAKKMGLQEVPAITLADLGEAQLRALRLALNRLAEDSQWDPGALTLEFSEILEIDAEIDLQISGFEMAEIDVALEGASEDEEDDLFDIGMSAEPVTRPGDLWSLGDHRILCDDALLAESYCRLLNTERAEMMFTDPPWNFPIEGNVSGLGAVKHKDFAMASGEMSSQEFQVFLATALGHAAEYSTDGSLHYVCIDWRHMLELTSAVAKIYSETKNLCVWNKTNAGMGSLYRSQHELIFVFKKGHQPHINNIELGRFGRHRSNVWTYPGQNVLNGSKSKLSVHPTVKPVALVADALRDCSNRGGLIIDPFGGAGTTILQPKKLDAVPASSKSTRAMSTSQSNVGRN